jgi:hypothetical protein
MSQDHSQPDQQSGRRDFLIRSATLLTALTLVNQEGDVALAQPKEKVAPETLRRVMQEAMQSGNMDQAIQQHGLALPPKLKEDLKQLTPGDLKQLQELSTKFKKIEDDMDGGINVIGVYMM